MSVQGFEDLINGPLTTFVQLSNQIGGDVATQAALVLSAFQAEFQFIKYASEHSAPSDSEKQKLLLPTSTKIQEIQTLREKNRGSPFFNHLSAISESIPALGWVAVSPTPAPYVKESNDTGQFYTNRVLKEWKEKNKTHVEWARTWVQLLVDLQAYVKQHHTTGLVWAKAGTKPSGGPPPPPPPCGLPPMDDLCLAPSDPDATNRSALFAEINRGTDVTKSLKKVSPDMQTHKNPSMRASGPAPAVIGNSSGVSAPKPAVEKPPVFARDGKKWLVENQKNNTNLVVDGAEMNNVVYIFKCVNSTITVKNKINSIVMDSCKKSSVVFESLVSSAEFINCQSVQMQVLGKVPTITIDKTDGCQMYLSKDSLTTEIVTSKSSELNVMVPKADGDYSEYPIPEQFKTTIGPKGLNTVVIEASG
ncbi:adenylyl cyclase-associated protein 1 [Acyrthosiphon pisum]|uniref:Adenylyl cyclase-associated protein n=1 Tax=Acyrthosiphon pisum TaxID=7029 RepID=A0A8R2A5K8_ACYPI|nr:adenylyl cyclase-associated protein 1 [Acyrthosiphon pisum]|eukprot:XP_001947404.1 PREDICTED: adenylyl cyclase-associated protein 1 [Acyrthosiphon pisum]